MHSYVRRWLRGLVILTCLLPAAFTQALDVHGDYHALDDEFDYYIDHAGQLELEQLLAEPERYPFLASADSKAEASFEPVWLRLNLHFPDKQPNKRYYLSSMVGNLYDIRFYAPDGNGAYREWITGNDYPASSRPVDSPHYSFVVDAQHGDVTLYLRIVGGPGANKFPWVLVEESTFGVQESRYVNFYLVCITAIATLLLFNLCLAVSLRKLDHLYYSAYIFCVLMALLTVDGVTFYYFWPDTPALNSRAMHSFNMGSAAMRLLAVTSFLGMAARAPRLQRLTRGVLLLLLLGAVAVNLVGIKNLPAYTMTYIWAVGILMGYVVCGHAIKLRVKLAVSLFVVLVLPTLAALVQAVLTVSHVGDTAIVLQLAKIGFVVHVLLFSLCLATQIRTETESRISALHDSLTGLPGTTLLRERFEQALQLSRRQKCQVAVFFLDLDGFKAINDGLGHAAGDQLLVEVAARMQGELRQVDTVARIGGDEFVVLLTEVTDADSARAAAEKLLAAVSAPYWLEHSEARVSASIGIAIAPDAGSEFRTLLKTADSAMYAAKHKGKNTYVIADTEPALSAETAGNLKMVAS